MKKSILLFVITVMSIYGMNAQDIKLGLNLGLPTGDIKDAYTFNLGVNASCLWQVSEEFDAGFIAEYSHFFGDSFDGFDIEDAGFLPIAAAGRINLSGGFTLGADLGYALGISPEGNDGGFFYQPKVQYGITEKIDILLSYKGISVDGGTFSTINVGVEFGI